MICLDTNAAIDLLNDANSRVLPLIDEAVESGSQVTLPSVVEFELWYGAAHSARRQWNERRISEFIVDPIRVADFDRDDAREAGDIRAHLRRSGTPIGPYDILIAAQARRRNAVLVTANIREFQRVPGLATEDWTAA